MKKTIIAAGAASVALAAMPIVGAFALTSHTDTLQVDIQTQCSFGYTDGETPHVINVPAPAHTDGSAGAAPGAWTGDTLSATMLNGTALTDFGKTTLSVYCNNEDGYSIEVTSANALAGATVSNSIPVNDSFSASSTGWSYKLVAGASNRGTVEAAHDDTWATSANAAEVIAGYSGATANAGDSYTITYGVGVDETLPADTYTGTITYVLNSL